MGMDLSPLNPDVDGAHYNFTGWGIIGDLLIELGCDLSAMSGSNDGDVVGPDTARAWGEAIRDALDAGTIYVQYFEDSTYAGGLREELHVEGTLTPRVPSTAAYLKALFAGEPDRPAEEPVRRESVTPGSETYAWLERAATFFETSGGFHQY